MGSVWYRNRSSLLLLLLLIEPFSHVDFVSIELTAVLCVYVLFDLMPIIQIMIIYRSTWPNLEYVVCLPNRFVVLWWKGNCPEIMLFRLSLSRCISVVDGMKYREDMTIHSLVCWRAHSKIEFGKENHSIKWPQQFLSNDQDTHTHTDTQKILVAIR